MHCFNCAAGTNFWWRDRKKKIDKFSFNVWTIRIKMQYNKKNVYNSINKNTILF